MNFKNLEIILEYSSLELAEQGVAYLIINAFQSASAEETKYHSWVVQASTGPFSTEQVIPASFITGIPTEGLLYAKIQGSVEEGPHKS